MVDEQVVVCNIEFFGNGKEISIGISNFNN